MERVYWCPVEFNGHSLYVVASRVGVKFISDSTRGISQIYDFYHQSFEFEYQASIMRPYHRLLIRYLNGDQIQNERVAFDLRGTGTHLDRRVWSAVVKIPYGEVRTVAQLASQLRVEPVQIEKAIGKNPVPIFVPTHRVIVSSQKLGRFRENLGMKSQLLEIETIMRNVENE